MAQGMTPEERLFKAVEAGAVASSGGGGGSPTSLFGAGAPGRGGPERWVQLVQKMASAQPIRRLNQGLMALLAVLTIYLGYDVMATPRQLAKELEASRTVATSGPELASEPAAQASLDDFLDAVRKRDVFHPPGTMQTVTSSGGAAAAPAASLAEGLRLVGIAWGDKAEAMIDDQQAKQTFFLTEGQKIRALTVEKITQDHVTLKNDAGQRVTL